MKRLSNLFLPRTMSKPGSSNSEEHPSENNSTASESHQRRAASDSGSVELPSPLLLGASGDTRASASSPMVPRDPGAPTPPYAWIQREFPHPPPLLPKVALSEQDSQRLRALAKLMRVETPETVIDCCTLFNNEILQDFPAQIFLYEPEILESLIYVVESGLKINEETQLVVCALGSLNKMVKKITTQIYKYRDPNMISTAEEPPQPTQRAIRGRGWSVLEFCWSGLSVSSQCLLRSDIAAVLMEALDLLRSCLAIYSTFFLNVNAAERSRLSLLLAEVLQSKPPTFAYLQMLQIVKRYITQWPNVLKESELLKQVIQNAIVNAGVWCLNKELARELLILLRDLPHEDKFCRLVGGVTRMCQALSSMHQLLISSGEGMNHQKITEALPSLDFIPSGDQVGLSVEVLCRDLSGNSGSPALLALLAHTNPAVQSETYKCCYQVVQASIGVQQAKDPVSYIPDNITFLTNDKVLQEIVCFGLNHENKKVRKYAEDILEHLIRSRLLVSGTLWSKISSCIAYLLPLLTSKMTSSNVLQQALLSYLTPSCKNVDTFQLIRGNACLLFSNDENVRKEGASRLMAIVECHPESYKRWPQLSTMPPSSQTLSSLCYIKDPINFNESSTAIFYNESSLRQIIALLGPGGSDANVKYSALCQLAAMLLETRLIPAFIKAGGCEICISLLDSALLQHNTEVLSKSVKPIIIILSRIVGDNANMCRTLAQDENLLMNLIRAMFVYCSIDADFQLHLSALLAMLLFSDFLRYKEKFLESEEKQKLLVLPQQLLEGVQVPFHAGSYSKASSHTPIDHWQRLRSLARVEDTENLSLLLRCYLTLEKIETLHDLKKVQTLGNISIEEALRLLQFDPVSMLKKVFEAVASATSHDQVLQVLPELTSYLPCLSSSEREQLPWKDSFSKFVSRPPATVQDEALLRAVIRVTVHHKVVAWIPVKDIISKLDVRQHSTVQTFLPLLEFAAPYLKEHIGELVVAICRFLGSLENFNETAPLRSTLHCLRAILTAHSIQISSRLMADFLGPLIDIVGRFDIEGSFVTQDCLIQSLHCLSLLQANNCQNFSRHLYAYSEECDIFNVMLHIISSDSIIAKALVISTLSGMASCDGLKNGNIELAPFLKLILSITIDRKEACFVRQRAVHFLSCLLEASKKAEVEDFIFILMDCQWFEEIVLDSDLYLDEVFQFANSEENSSPAGSPTENVRNIITPELLAARYMLVYNLCCGAPTTMLKKVKQHGLLSHALNTLSACLSNLSKVTAEICRLVIQASNLITFCLITDENEIMSKELTDYPYLAAQLLKVLETPKVFEMLEGASLWLMLSMHQAAHGDIFVSAFHQGLFWNTICHALESPRAEKPALLLIRGLTVQAKKATSPICLSEADSGCKRTCELLMLRLQREETHQESMAALAGLLSTWPEVCKHALQGGLLESIVAALRHCRISLLGIRDLRSLAHTEKQVHPFIEELMDSFQLLVGFMLHDSEIRKSASETILNEELNHLWTICLMNTKLRAAALKFLTVYTADCEDACLSLLLRQQFLSGVKVKRCPTNTSLLHQLCALASTHLKGELQEVCTVFQILRHCCVSVECRATIVKTNLLQEILVDRGGLVRHNSEVQKAALLMVETLTRHPEGQLAVAKIPFAIENLTVLSTDKVRPNFSELILLAVEILRNVCFCHANRVLVLNSGPLISCFLQLLQIGPAPLVRCVAAAVWSLSANQHRSKQALKVAGFPQALSRARLQYADCQDAIPILDKAMEVLTTE